MPLNKLTKPNQTTLFYQIDLCEVMFIMILNYNHILILKKIDIATKCKVFICLKLVMNLETIIVEYELGII